MKELSTGSLGQTRITMFIKFFYSAILHRLTWLVCFMNIILPLSAQFNEQEFILHARKNGLTNSNITGLVQDEAGYIWIGTAKGLNRYDGSSFFQVYLQQFSCYDEYGSVSRMKYFGNNEIGIATNNGGYSFNTLTLSSKAFLAAPLFGSGATFNKCRDIEKNTGNNYFTSTGTGFYIFDEEGKLVSRKDAVSATEAGGRWFQFGSNMQLLKNGSVLQQNKGAYFLYNNESKKTDTLLDETTGALYKKILTPASPEMNDFLYYITRYNAVFVINAETNTLDIVNNFYQPEIAQSISLPFEAKKEITWQSNFYPLSDTSFAITLSGKGFYIFNYNPKNNRAAITPNRFFNQHFCTALLMDKNNKLWIGTDKGLLQQQSNTSTFKTFNIQPHISTSISPYIRGIFVDSQQIFVGGRQMGSLLIMDSKTKNITRQVELNDTHHPFTDIISFYPRSKDTLWVGTNRGLIWLNKRNYSYGRITDYDYKPEFNSLSFKHAFTDSRKNAWFITNEYNTVFYFSTAENKFYVVNQVSAGQQFKIAVCSGMGEDSNGFIWFGGDGICRWDPATGLCDSLKEKVPNSTSSYASVNVFYSDREQIWLSNAAGVYEWDPVKNTTHLFNIKSGLPDNQTFAHVSPIDKNKLFIHTNYGLAILDRKSQHTMVFTEKDGIPDVALCCQMSYAFNVAANEYLFGYANYLVALPVNFEKISLPPHSINITSIHVLQDTTFYHPQNKIILPYNQNDLSVTFNAVNFNDPDNQVFAYRLLKTNELDWTVTNRQNIIYLNNLSSGNYRLQVKVMAANKRWTDQLTELTITVKPAFWETWWFITLSGFLTAIAIYLLVKVRIKNIRQKANLDQLLAQTKMKALHAQMNPHFIFNCLNSINEMILLNENAQASKYLSKFAHLIRITLEHSSQAWTSLRQTIDYLKRYLEMENIRIDDVSYSIHTDEELDIDDTFLPPMLIQPLIENAIWHGKKQGEALTIAINFEKKNNQLLCIVSDNGKGIDHSMAEKKQHDNYQSIAINNIRQRIQLLNEKYNLDSELTLQDKKDTHQQGTLAILKLPLKLVVE